MVPWEFEGKTYMRYYYLFDEKELRKNLAAAGLEIVSLMGSESKAYNLFPRNLIAIARKV
jgi:hypothetical protein